MIKTRVLKAFGILTTIPRLWANDYGPGSGACGGGGAWVVGHMVLGGGCGFGGTCCVVAAATVVVSLGWGGAACGGVVGLVSGVAIGACSPGSGDGGGSGSSHSGWWWVGLRFRLAHVVYELSLARPMLSMSYVFLFWVWT
ncbi:hypothetical protein RHMOL_Rhmol10G0070900 [Rhododendron molle]|uniref:Uncharacterized protein n=1 Tax=Rhododendron molle TaxID=49168 RepID=A0ACC0M0U0_RHOML|nr:hypothetical protein RHMOL_Rhmol10G0070900 [Rhododendron molle]